MLWHKRLGHISEKRIRRLVSKGIINPLDFADLVFCRECVKGKQTNKTRRGALRSSAPLELIHTDICGPFPSAAWNGQRYLLTLLMITRVMVIFS